MNTLTAQDILQKQEYEKERPELRRHVIVSKRGRRVAVGDHCTVHFESVETMRYQVHEMLRAEDSWDRPDALEEELEAYNPLIPQSGELSATVMFEYETKEERDLYLTRLLGIDKHLWLCIGETEPVLAVHDGAQVSPERISSVQYVKWNLTDSQREILKKDGTVIRIKIDHPHYTAESVFSEESRKAIMTDPD